MKWLNEWMEHKSEHTWGWVLLGSPALHHTSRSPIHPLAVPSSPAIITACLVAKAGWHPGQVPVDARTSLPDNLTPSALALMHSLKMPIASGQCGGSPLLWKWNCNLWGTSATHCLHQNNILLELVEVSLCTAAKILLLVRHTQNTLVLQRGGYKY